VASSHGNFRSVNLAQVVAAPSRCDYDDSARKCWSTGPQVRRRHCNFSPKCFPAKSANRRSARAQLAAIFHDPVPCVLDRSAHEPAPRPESAAGPGFRTGAPHPARCCRPYNGGVACVPGGHAETNETSVNSRDATRRYRRSHALLGAGVPDVHLSRHCLGMAYRAGCLPRRTWPPGCAFAISGSVSASGQPSTACR
jgi:hypothetical protein